MKICTECKKSKPLIHFHKTTKSKDGRRWKCKECRNNYLREWGRKNPEKRRAQKYRIRYGIDLKDYDELLIKQNKKCKICNSTDPGRDKYFHVDHCHKTKTVRGLLCDNCNKGLGHFKDDKEVLKKAIEYLT